MKTNKRGVKIVLALVACIAVLGGIVLWTQHNPFGKRPVEPLGDSNPRLTQSAIPESRSAEKRPDRRVSALPAPAHRKARTKANEMPDTKLDLGDTDKPAATDSSGDTAEITIKSSDNKFERNIPGRFLPRGDANKQKTDDIKF